MIFEPTGNDNKVEFFMKKDISFEDQQRAISLPKRKQKSRGYTDYERLLTCPDCGGFDFFMYRDCYDGGHEVTNSPVTEMAECLNCACNTCAFALKHKYNKENMTEDFPIAMK
jgi:hypothetical protein